MSYGKKKHGGMHSGKVSKTGQAGVLGQFAPKRMDDKRHARAAHPTNRGGDTLRFRKSMSDPTAKTNAGPKS